MTLVLGPPRANRVLRLKSLDCCDVEWPQEFEKLDDAIAKAWHEDQQFDPNEWTRRRLSTPWMAHHRQA
jgi:hypothetical protein